MAEEKFDKIGEQVDTLVNLDIHSRGYAGLLYKHAREKIGSSLTLKAAQKIKQALNREGRIVVIGTGASALMPGIPVEIGEMDGPPGAIALATALCKLRCIPVLITEPGEVRALSHTAEAAGLIVASLEGAKLNANRIKPSVVAVEGFPCNDEEAVKVSKDFVSNLDLAAVIAIEHSGMNEKGVHHNSRGQARMEHKARIDHLFLEASKRNVCTIGIGDGGNEIGMGLIRDAIKKLIPYGEKCQCPCGGGVVPATGADVLVTSAVSNWGAYGVVACLSAIHEDPSLLHTPDLERRILVGAADAGYVDPFTGYRQPYADGLPTDIHVSVVNLLSEMVKWGLEQKWKERYKKGV